MLTGLGDFAPQIVALLLGGLLGSLGLVYVARTKRARPTLAAASGARFTVVALAIVALAGTAAVLVARRALARLGPELQGVSAGELLLFGFLIGVPLSLPGVLFAWSEARAKRRKRDFVPTKDDRRGFATDLERQLAELDPERQGITASIGGDGGRVLVLDGALDAEKGERLTAALRTELSELGFKRVEGGTGGGAWWTRV